MNSSNCLAIIPAAGYGTRLGMPVNGSKEMCQDPVTHEPIIKWSLDLCRKYHVRPLVITRSEKNDLNDYLDYYNIEHILISPNGEWPNTVLLSEAYWQENNILILPDTRFSSEKTFEHIKESLELEASVVFALHKVDDISKWGHITGYNYCEKPNVQKSGFAWGLIGFKKHAGGLIFNNMNEQGIFHNHVENTNFLFLDSFQDITRNGTVDKWK